MNGPNLSHDAGLLNGVRRMQVDIRLGDGVVVVANMVLLRLVPECAVADGIRT